MCPQEDAVPGPVDAPRPRSVQRTLMIFSDPWAFTLLQESFYGVRRFEVLQRNLGISRNVLAKRLKSLVSAGVLSRVQYQDRPPRFEYRLTDKGRALYPIFLAMTQWGEDWLGDDGTGEDWELVHTSCGETTRPHMTCNRCGEPVDVQSVRIQPKGTPTSPDDDTHSIP